MSYEQNSTYRDGCLNIQETYELKYFQRLINLNQHIKIQNDLISFLKSEYKDLEVRLNEELDGLIKRDHEECLLSIKKKDEFIKYLKLENDKLKNRNSLEGEFRIRKDEVMLHLKEENRVIKMKNYKLSKELSRVVGTIVSRDKRINELESIISESNLVLV